MILTQITQKAADYPFADCTERVIAPAYRVHKVLGAGFLESVYVKALQIELTTCGSSAQLEVPIAVTYKGQVVGEFRADLLVDDAVIVEVKAIKELSAIHEAQLVNYLNGTGKAIGLLLNFGVSVQIRRKIVSKNLRKSAQSA